MAIRLIDAVDSMVIGGYIDLLQERYIPPMWFSELCEENNTGFTAEDYDEFERNPARYLKPPVVHSVALRGIAAGRMGITQEQLCQWGMNKGEYWEIFYPHQPGDNYRYCYRYSDAEGNIMHAIDNYMLSIGQYNAFASKESEVLCEIVTKWMHEHGVSLIE